MGSYKRPRVFDPLDLQIMDLVYEAASAQLAARHPLSNPDEESVRQALKKLVFACAQFGSVEFDALLDKVLKQSEVMRIAELSYSTRRVKVGGGEQNALQVSLKAPAVSAPP